MKRCVFMYWKIYFSTVLILSAVRLGTDAKSYWKNVAVWMHTNQSSLFNANFSSELAVDDDDTSCSRTAAERSSSWTVYFDNVRIISRLVIDTGNTFFGSNFEIFISPDHVSAGLLCSYGPTSDVMVNYTFSCYGGPMSGRSLTIVNKYSSGVQLCEVQLMECEDGYFGTECSLQCHCDVDEFCYKGTGECPKYCAAGWNGTSCQDRCAAGTFGIGCSQTCHCFDDEPCEVEMGTCSSGQCSSGYLGDTCQTVFPTVQASPSFVASREKQITIRWRPWTGEIEPSFTLLYLIEYQLNPLTHLHHGNNSEWVEGPLVVHDPAKLDELTETVTGLRRNTFYDFRIKPVLRKADGGWLNGTSSAKSSSFRTKCSVPEVPLITNITSFTLKRPGQPLQVVIGVEWKLLSEEESNCERVRNYEILYQRQDGNKPLFRVGASNTATAKNITDNLDFDTEYWVTLTVFNNQPLESSSERKIVLTPSKPKDEIDLSKGNYEEATTKAGAQEVLIIVIIILSVAVIAAIVLGVFLYRHRANKFKSHRGHTDVGYSVIPAKTCPVFTPDMPLQTRLINSYPEERRITKIPDTRPPPVPHFPIPVSELEKYIMSRQRNECEDLRKEYMEIPDKNPDASSSVGERAENRLKNRFINIIPYDHSRVVLDTLESDSDSHYINASYIDGYNSPKAYIASQGCNKWTIQDMWRMVWQVHSCRIVMVTNLVEKGKTKCELYWPEVEGEEKIYSEISVTLTDIERTADFDVRTFRLVCNGEKRQVKHFHFTAWPDHGVPNRTAPIVEFRRKVRLYDESYPGPIVIHCSAGVGRTGAFIAIDALLDQANAEGQVDVYNFTCKMRLNRTNMIQTNEQYIFVYNALLEALKAGNTVIACADFKKAYELLRHIDVTKGKSGLLEQFETLQTMLPNDKPDDYNQANVPENKQKNRFSLIVPAERHRPYLMTRVQGTNDYINAVFLDGYRNRNAYIVTQMPLPHTVIDLWRMVFEHKCSIIVMMNPWDENDTSYGQYWPEENEECECGPFIIEAVSVDTSNADITVRQLKLTYIESSQSTKKPDDGIRLITQFQYNCWPRAASVPLNQLSLITLLDMVERSQRKTGAGPIVIHCHDGVRQSGLYAVVSYIWERLKDEQEIDIFQAVRHLRYHRPQIVQDVEQYEFCYEMVLTYLAEFETYSNFR